jgi:hypothetical protein
LTPRLPCPARAGQGKLCLFFSSVTPAVWLVIRLVSKIGATNKISTKFGIYPSKTVLEDKARRGVTAIVLAYKSWRRDQRSTRAANEVRRAASE